MHGQVCLGVLRSQAGQCYVNGSVARVFFVGFDFVLRFAVMVLLFGVVCSVSLVLAQFRGTLV